MKELETDNEILKKLLPYSQKICKGVCILFANHQIKGKSIFSAGSVK